MQKSFPKTPKGKFCPGAETLVLGEKKVIKTPGSG